MKKTKLLLLLASSFMLAGCSAGEYFYPKNGGNWVAPPVKEGEDVEIMTTYNIYFSYWTTTKYNEYLDKDEDSPILTFQHPMLKPLGKAPSEIAVDGSEDPNAIDKAKVLALGEAKGYTPDPYYNKFLGFSFNGACLDETGLWDFTKDFKEGMATLTLFGVWVHSAE